MPKKESQLALEPLEPVRVPLAEVDEQRPQSAGMETNAHHVDRRLEQLGIRCRREALDVILSGHEPYPAAILLAKGNPELLEDPQEHLASRLRAPRLYEAQMAGRGPGLKSEFELGHAAVLAPLVQERSDLGLRLNRRHCGRF